MFTADGRESDTQSGNSYLYDDAPAPGSPNANHVRAYNRIYAYDKLGNITDVIQSGITGFTRHYVYNANHNTLQKIENATPATIEDYTYDTNGNQLTAGSTRNYVWNHADQLICYYNQAGSGDPTIYTQYDYSGQDRVSKLVRTGTLASPVYERTIYIDGIFEYVKLENGSTYEKNYIRMMDDKSNIAEIRINNGAAFPGDIADDVVYNLEDQIGSSTVRLDINGTIIDKEEYYPFGDSSLRTFTYKRYRYVGKERDAESGLYYYGARYYAAWTCRFISVDPLADKYVHITSYNYADNNPINDFDIDGQQDGNTKQTGGSNPAAPTGGTATNSTQTFSKDENGNTVSDTYTQTQVQTNNGQYTLHQCTETTNHTTGEVTSSSYDSSGDIAGMDQKTKDIAKETIEKGTIINSSLTVYNLGQDLDIRKKLYVDPYKKDLITYNNNPTHENKINAAVNRQNNLAEVREKISPLGKSFSNSEKSFQESVKKTNEIISGERNLGSSTNKGFDRFIPYRNIIKILGLLGLLYAVHESIVKIDESGWDPRVIGSEAGGWAGAYMVGAMFAAAAAALVGAILLGPIIVIAAGIAGAALGFWLGSGKAGEAIDDFFSNNKFSF